MQNNILKQGEVRSLQVRNGETIRSKRGVLWLTIDGRSEDYLLQPGQSWKATEAGRAVVQAMEAGEMEFSSPTRLGAVARLKAVWPWPQTTKLGGQAPGSVKRPPTHLPA